MKAKGETALNTENTETQRTRSKSRASIHCELTGISSVLSVSLCSLCQKRCLP
jgi:hypothetical protein